MRSAFFTGFLSMVALASSILLGQERDEVYQNRTDPRAAAAAANPGVAQTPAADRTDRWRYRFHNDQWWYYHRNGQWSYWNGDAWTRYRRPTYQRPTSSPYPPYAYRYGVGIRAPGMIQQEKNEARAYSLGPSDLRGWGTIQREKNDLRALESMDIRPEGTIQSEKNNVRGGE
jgi:hypothetical protein